MAVEDGPRLGAHSALRAFALHPKWRAPAITPDVPFCAEVRIATAVVLARGSVVGLRCEFSDSACACIAHHSEILGSHAIVMSAGGARPVALMLARVLLFAIGQSAVARPEVAP